MFTSRIVRLPAVWRVPLWALWFPLVAYPWHVLRMGLDGKLHRLFTRAHWSLTWRIYLLGLDGR